MSDWDLRILTWRGISIGATHWKAELHEHGDPREIVRVRRQWSQEQDDAYTEECLRWKPGGKLDGPEDFFSEAEAIQRGVEIWLAIERLQPGGRLFRGLPAYLSDNGEKILAEVKPDGERVVYPERFRTGRSTLDLARPVKRS